VRRSGPTYTFNTPKNDSLKVENNPWASVYQLGRFNTALKSVSEGWPDENAIKSGENITDRINVKLYEKKETF